MISSAMCFTMVARYLMRGHYDGKVQQGLHIEIILFIISEVCFFTSFFWVFFLNSSFAPAPDLGCI